MYLTENEMTLLQVLLNPPEFIIPVPTWYYDVPPRRIIDFVRATGLSIAIVADALDSLVAKSVLDVQHGPSDFIQSASVEPPDDEIGGVWYAISNTPSSLLAYLLMRGRNQRERK